MSHRNEMQRIGEAFQREEMERQCKAPRIIGLGYGKLDAWEQSSIDLIAKHRIRTESQGNCFEMRRQGLEQLRNC